MSNDTLVKFDGGLHQGDDRSAPYPVSRLAPAIELVDLAKEIAQADAMLTARTSSKLKVIADQIKQLQEMARTVMEEAQTEQMLHRAQCNFKRLPGKIYHLYRRDTDSLYFSMLSPADWKHQSPHPYVASYRLENDFSWTKVESI